ncbi:hypothetical protein VB780_11970 [Leptolyngbya sp. CCNP1308]|uniref:hypothetical protein n=1 Tax=Leptolyngbya sp. CCNP1308 TaxID=3110255 RepID=UPI002B21332F|nr:hypothetical protein [Leptolyngbya sp. CCNP1308]MEA5449290.1 hypothetical protein [Leptolyngbya sp. CCNP1308]
MKFKRSTVMLVGVAFLLGAGVLIAESQRSQSPESATDTTSTAPIFTFEETDVATLTVDRGDETLVFEQGDDETWQMTAPDEALAEPGAIAFLLSRLNTDSPLQTVTMQADQATDFGFNAPLGIVTATLKDGTEHELILGGPDFSGSANYAVVDPDPWPPAEGTEYSVLVVTRDVANGINRPLAEWKMPVETPASDNPGASSTPESSTPAASPPAPAPTVEPPANESQPAPAPTAPAPEATN